MSEPEEMKESKNEIIYICGCGYKETIILVGGYPRHFYCKNCKQVSPPS
jgi:hypothetical protein